MVLISEEQQRSGIERRDRGKELGENKVNLKLNYINTGV
jgi:hypothetical protein